MSDTSSCTDGHPTLNRSHEGGEGIDRGRQAMTNPFGLGGPSPEQLVAWTDAWSTAVKGQVVDHLAALIREVDGDHSLGAAALAEELVKRGVTVQPVAASSLHEALPELVQTVQVFTGEPTALRRLATVEQVAAMPDGTVVIWNDDRDDRQAGVLETEDGRARVVRPISIGRYEDDWHLGALIPPVWVVTFDDAPEVY